MHLTCGGLCPGLNILIPEIDSEIRIFAGSGLSMVFEKSMAFM